ncbi:aldehyde dehydrogenase family protein [Dactylosporangium sp. NPDC005572]|uniref:aldehyde dehydrogenase family protein n=1 Tax=Dactylosporangium sp. NPDC005572 TaxID=3156889 RepID=UPI0033A44D02
MTKQNLIGGRWCAGAAIVADVNPSDVTDIVDEYALADADQAREAVAAARAAQPGWAAASPQQRFTVLDTAGTEILRRAEDLGDLLAREEGKTRAEAIAEVNRAGQVFKFHAGQAVRATGEHLESIRTGVEVTVSREPVGVVCVVTPWNFPMAIPAWKIAPALAYGNTVVFKPAELVPASAWALVDILRRAGLPDGALNLLIGKGSVIGDTITGSPDVDAVSFTGSTDTGRKVLATATRHGARVQLEMGGKNPLVLVDDADLETAVRCAVEGAYGSTGQRCTASSRLIVTEGIHDRFVAALLDRLRAIRVGDARDPRTEMGPVVDERQLDQDERYLDVARREGAEVVGGKRLDLPGRGFYLSPALVLGSSTTDTINREEVFGPVASIIRVTDYDEALAVANDVDFGLTAGIVTTSLAKATDFRRRSTAGMVMVNVPTAGVDFHVPFGGRKASSYGPREQGTHAREFFTTTKTAYVAAGPVV